MPIVRATKVVNDSAERALGMITNFHLDRITRSEEQKQYLLQVQTYDKGNSAYLIHFDCFVINYDLHIKKQTDIWYDYKDNDILF